MNEKARSTLWMIAGVYLIYLGGKLAADSLNAKPNNYVLFMIAGVIFVIVGGVLIFNGLKYLKALRAETQEDDTEEIDAEDTEEIEAEDFYTEEAEEFYTEEEDEK